MRKSVIWLIIGLVLGGSIPANAATKSTTPATKYRYATNRAPYYMKSTSTYYRSVWSSARTAWTKSKAFTWTQKKSAATKSYTTSVSKTSGIWASATGIAYVGKSFDQNGAQTGAGMYLNRAILNKYKYTKKQRINVATHEMGHALGLNHNAVGSVSVMNPTNRRHTIAACDTRGVKAVYKTPLTAKLTTMTAAAKPEMVVDHNTDYNGQSGLTALKKAAPVIVEGEVVKSVSHHKAPKNYYTTQTLTVDHAFKGKIGKTITFTQAGTTSMAVADSEILHKGEEVLVMLAKDPTGNYYAINDGQGLFIETDHATHLFEHVSDHAMYKESALH